MAQHKPASTEDPTSQDDRSGSPKPAVAPSKPGTPLQTVAEEPTPFGPIRRHGLREATELEPRPAAPKTPDLPAGVELQADGSPRPPERHRSAWSRLNVFWDRQISLVVPHEDCRDHFGPPHPFPPPPRILADMRLHQQMNGRTWPTCAHRARWRRWASWSRSCSGCRGGWTLATRPRTLSSRWPSPSRASASASPSWSPWPARSASGASRTPWRGASATPAAGSRARSRSFWCW